MIDLELYENIQKHRKQGKDAVLAIVVDTRGSTPRQAGTKMGILSGENYLGTIGGGSVEAKVKKAAYKILQTKKTDKMTVKLNDEIGKKGGDICGGIMTILLEYLPALEK